MGKKSVNNLYKPMLEHSNVEQKFHKAAKGKTERPDVAVILEPTNIQRHVKNVVEQRGRVAFRVLHVAVVVKFHVAASRPFHQRAVESGALYPVYG